MYTVSDKLDDSGFLPMFGDELSRTLVRGINVAVSSVRPDALNNKATGADGAGLDGMQMEMVQFEQEEYGSQPLDGENLSQNQGP